MKNSVKILAVIVLAALVFSGCKKEGTIVVKNNTRSTYEAVVTDNLNFESVRTIAAGASDANTSYDVERSYYLVATQKDGYFEHPFVLLQDNMNVQHHN